MLWTIQRLEIALNSWLRNDHDEEKVPSWLQLSEAPEGSKSSILTFDLSSDLASA